MRIRAENRLAARFNFRYGFQAVSLKRPWRAPSSIESPLWRNVVYAYDLLSFDPVYSDENDLHCRPARESDLDSMLAIEESSFEFPWSRDDFLFCLRASRCEAIVIERDAAVVGYAIYERRSSSIRLLSLAVAAVARRHGVGAALFGALVALLDDKRREIVCTASERNVVARRFLQRLGFRSRWVERKFYREIDCAAHRMVFSLDERFAYVDSHDVKKAG